MIRSMTGFGKGVKESPYGKITAEIKTLNHKYLSISCAPFEGFFLLEERAKSVLEKKIYRGKVFVKISRENVGTKKTLQQIGVNERVAGEYLKKIKKMQKELGVGGDIGIQDLVGLSGVIEYNTEKKEDKVWPYVKGALEEALASLMKYRSSEGRRLEKDFNKRLIKVRKGMQEIKKYEKQSVASYRKKLVQTVQELAKKADLDKGRLEAEVALFAKNCDIAEEITRLGSHLTAYKNAIGKEGKDIGKKLDFIAQEMHREANTIGAKSGDYRISNAVIEVKSDIEKMREQIKNIE